MWRNPGTAATYIHFRHPSLLEVFLGTSKHNKQQLSQAKMSLDIYQIKVNSIKIQSITKTLSLLQALTMTCSLSPITLITLQEQLFR